MGGKHEFVSRRNVKAGRRAVDRGVTAQRNGKESAFRAGSSSDQVTRRREKPQPTYTFALDRGFVKAEEGVDGLAALVLTLCAIPRPAEWPAGKKFGRPVQRKLKAVMNVSGPTPECEPCDCRRYGEVRAVSKLQKGSENLPADVETNRSATDKLRALRRNDRT